MVSLRHVHKELKKYRKPGTKSQVKVFLHLSRRVYHKFRIIWTFILVSNFFFHLCERNFIIASDSSWRVTIIQEYPPFSTTYNNKLPTEKKNTNTTTRGNLGIFFSLPVFVLSLWENCFFFFVFSKGTFKAFERRTRRDRLVKELVKRNIRSRRERLDCNFLLTTDRVSFLHRFLFTRFFIGILPFSSLRSQTTKNT